MHRRDVGVERACIAKVSIPDLVDGIAKEFGGGAFGGFIRGMILDEDGMLGFPALAYSGRGVVGDGRVGGWALGSGKGSPPRRRVGGRWFEDADEVVAWMCPMLVVRDIEEEGVQDVSDRREIIVGRLAHDGLEVGGGRGEESRDLLGRHDDDGGGVRSGRGAASSAAKRESKEL